jgi:hypothetical protein
MSVYTNSSKYVLGVGLEVAKARADKKQWVFRVDELSADVEKALKAYFAGNPLYLLEIHACPRCQRRREIKITILYGEK